MSVQPLTVPLARSFSNANPLRRSRFHPDSDDENEDSDVDLDFLSSSKLSLGGSGLAQSSNNVGGGTEFCLSGQLDDEEDSQLNPYRVAYESGWHRANEEMESDIKAGGGREVRP